MQIVTQFLKMETLLDDSVEQKIELQIERGGTPLTVDLLVNILLAHIGIFRLFPSFQSFLSLGNREKIVSSLHDVTPSILDPTLIFKPTKEPTLTKKKFQHY